MVKFAQVEEVVDIIAIAFWAGGFAARWQPDVVDASVFEGGKGGEEALVVGLIGGDVPFEALEEGGVGRSWFVV